MNNVLRLVVADAAVAALVLAVNTPARAQWSAEGTPIELAAHDYPLGSIEFRGDGGVVCHEENVQGSGLFCIRYLCGADDGGATFDGCCRLVG